MRPANLKRQGGWLFALGVLVASYGVAASADATGPVPGVESLTALTVEGLSSEPGDDDPRILYILPWQPPSIPRRPHSHVDNERQDLVAPIDPLVLERHRNFRKTLNPDLDSPFTLN